MRVTEPERWLKPKPRNCLCSYPKIIYNKTYAGHHPKCPVEKDQQNRNFEKFIRTQYGGR